MNLEVSNGELIDKYTILRIKSSKITDPEKLKVVLAELDTLTIPVEMLRIKYPGIDQAINALQDVNVTLWDIENAIREKEKSQEFDQAFINLARSVYFNNDQRAHIKSVINQNTGTAGEVKQYSDYKA
jgi:hypothetical protein